MFEFLSESISFLTPDARRSLIEVEGFPNDYIWIGISKEEDGATYRRVLDGWVADPDSPTDPFVDWWPQYPSPTPASDFILTYNNVNHPQHAKVYNTGETGKHYFGCEYEKK